MTPKERLDMVHAKQLCLLCLQHPLSVGCEAASKGISCPMGDCDRPQIERNINRADWDVECYEGCQKLLQREVQRMGAVSDDRRQEEASVLTELEVQRWVDEALAAREDMTPATTRPFWT